MALVLRCVRGLRRRVEAPLYARQMPLPERVAVRANKEWAREEAVHVIQRVFRAAKTVRQARRERRKSQDLSLKRLVFTDNHAARVVQGYWKGYTDREVALTLSLTLSLSLSLTLTPTLTLTLTLTLGGSRVSRQHAPQARRAGPRRGSLHPG